MTANPPFRTIQLQRDTAANWTSANTLLAEGELGLEMDTRKAKIGDGVTQWNSLSYAFSGVGGGDMLKSDNLSGLADYAVARSNMGLGSLATQSGTFSDKEDVANKSLSVVTDLASDTKYPSVKAVYDWATGLFATISNLALKANIDSPTFTGTVGLPAGQVVNGVTLSTAQGTGNFLRGDGTYAAPAGAGDMVLASTQTNSGLKTFLNSTFGLRNVANTFTGLFTNTITAARTWTLPDVSGTLVTGGGTASGTNTGDNATNSTYTTLATTLSTANSWSAVQTFLSGMLGLRNVANTFTSFFTNTNTASRTYTLKDASGTLAFTTDITGTNSGTNTGDQTSIVGITGTKAQFDTAVTDGNFMYVGDAPTAHNQNLSTITDVTMTVANLNALDDGVNTALHFHDTDRARANHTGTQTASTISDFTEATQDAVGAMIDASLTYVDGTPLLQRSALTGAITSSAGSNTTALGSFTKAQLDTAVSDGNVLYVGDIVSSSTTAAGIVELATTAEINTGTDTTRAMPVDQFVASNRNVRYFDIYAIEKATDNAVGNNIAGAFECPFTGTITEIGAYVETAGVTGASVWDVNKNGTTIMTTNKLSIDTAEVSTRTAATAPTLTTTAITAGDLITIDTDSLSTTKPKGLHVRIGIRLT